MVSYTGLVAQDSVPITKGDVLVTGTQLSDTKLSDIALTPSVGYAFTDQIVGGVSTFKGDQDDWSGGVYARYYPSGRLFAESGITYNTVSDDVTPTVKVGATAVFFDWLLIEPNIAVDFEDGDTGFGLGVDLGVKF